MTAVSMRGSVRGPQALLPSDYQFHIAVFANEQDASRFLVYLSPMEGLTIMNLYRDGCSVVFDAAAGGGIDEYAIRADWATVVRHFNCSDEPAWLDGHQVWGRG